MVNEACKSTSGAIDMGRRQVPLRVAPVADEAIDSWLGALGRRHDVSFADLVECFGLSAAPRNISWWLWLPPHARDSIAHVTGVESDCVWAMTLQRYLSGSPLEGRVRPMKNALWVKSSGSRFCPDCLHAHPGRWQLSWRLNWNFVCIRHRRLLLQTCLYCGRTQRQHLLQARGVPAVGNQCCSGRHDWACTRDLSEIQGATLPAHNVILRTQHTINDFLSGQDQVLAAFGEAPQHAFAVLRDLKMLARWSSACVAQQYVEACLPADFAERIAAFRAATRWPDGQYWSGCRADLTVDETALGAVIAVKLATAKSFSVASKLLREFIRTATPVARFPDAVPRPAGLGPGLRALRDCAYAPVRAERRILRRFRCAAARSMPREPMPERICR
ncbi:TniQ family protein [Mycobacterium sp. DBP42]|nr:TniQ family protein [Mycobacterium sp. DBP42]